MTAVFQGRIPASSPEAEVERRRALRAVLRKPLLVADGENAENYVLVRRHSAWLKQWLTQFPAWGLHIDKDVVRLRKVPPDLLDETRPAVDCASSTAFSRRRYVLLCLALATLERSDRQTTLSRIAQTIVEFTVADQGLTQNSIVFDSGNYDQRRDLVHAIRLLMDIGVLRKLEGDERHFLERSGSSDVCYEINRPVLAAMLNVSRSASAMENIERSAGDSPLQRATKLIENSIPAGEDPGRQRLRSRIVRMLLDDPILYFEDLNDEERTYLEQHRSYLLEQIHEATGLLAEVRREGIAMVDDKSDLTDIQLPEDSTDGHLSVLVLEWLAEFARKPSGEALSVSTVEEYVRGLIGIHGSRWRKEVREAGAEGRLTLDTLLRLRALRLIRLTPDGVIPLAACGRYVVSDAINSPAREE